VNLELHGERAVRGFEDCDLLPIDVVSARNTILAVASFRGFLVHERANACRLLRVGGDLGGNEGQLVPGTCEGGRHGNHQDRSYAQRYEHRAKIKPGVLEQGILLKWCGQSSRGTSEKTPSFAIMAGDRVEL
jgi:hypothetical protein